MKPKNSGHALDRRSFICCSKEIRRGQLETRIRETTYYTISISVIILPLSARNTRLVLVYTSQNETGLHFLNSHRQTGGQTEICQGHREPFVSRVIERFFLSLIISSSSLFAIFSNNQRLHFFRFI